MNEPLKELQQIVNLQYRTSREAAKALGMSESYLSLILAGKRNIPYNILRRLGYEWQIVSMNPLPHPADANPPVLVVRELKEVKS